MMRELFLGKVISKKDHFACHDGVFSKGTSKECSTTLVELKTNIEKEINSIYFDFLQRLYKHVYYRNGI